MNFWLITLVVSALSFLTTCAGDSRGTTRCATSLDYVTNRFTAGDQAMRHASEYRAHLLMGEGEFTVEALLDTSASNLVINEKTFAYGGETQTGRKPFVYDDGHNRSMALNAKDLVHVGCANDFSARFALTAKEQSTPNLLGLAYGDPDHNPHELRSVPFFDQLVKKEGFNDEFSVALCGLRGNSRVVLGGIDDRMEKLMGNFIPIIEKTAYVVPALALKRADTKVKLGEFPAYHPRDKTGTRTILDTATSFLMLPGEMATGVALEIGDEARMFGLLNQFPDGFFRTERANSVKVVRFKNFSQMRQFPSLEITFQGFDGKEKSLEISPLHYFKEMDARDPLVRTFGIREASNDIILGQPFLENHYLYFDRKNARIGVGNIDIACAP